MQDPDQKPHALASFVGNFASALLIVLFIAGLYSVFVAPGTETPALSSAQLARDIDAGLVKTINVSGDVFTAIYADETTRVGQKEVENSLSETLTSYGVSSEALRDVPILIEPESGFAFWFYTLSPLLSSVLFIGVLFWIISRQVRGQSIQAMTFGQSRARIIDPADTKQRVTFKDVAGVKEAKEELLEIVDFLKNPEKFLEIGARIPRGVILIGAPGTGKTLLARAVAGEAGVPFLYLSGSEFVEMFVGVGASRTRDLFRLAKKMAPAIIFIDEIDAVGRHRGSGMGGGNDEREQTLNQILVEMDGFEQNEKVIVMAATNRPDVLDPALLRPGRFDRRVVLDPPDLKDREAILETHSKEKALGEDVNAKVIAERTPGFSGADLANLVNEAAILAARENRKKVSQFDLIRSIEKVMLGPERKSHILSDKEKERTAYHEMGHALVASVLPKADPVHKVTIISRGRAGGYTLKLPLEETRLETKEEFLADIAVSLGGYVAEQIVYGNISTGSSNDISVATAIARDMVMKYGMSEAVGPISFESTSPGMAWDRIPATKPYSETVATSLDAEVSELMQAGKDRAREVIEKHRAAFDAMAKELNKVETLERKEFEELLILHGIKPKKKGGDESEKVA